MTEEYITISDADIDTDITNFLGAQNDFIDANDIDNTTSNIINASGYINIKENIVDKLVHDISYEQFKNLNIMLNYVEKQIFEQIKTQNLGADPNLEAKIYLMWWLSFILNTGLFLVDCEDNFDRVSKIQKNYYENFETLILFFENTENFNKLYSTLEEFNDANIISWFNEFKTLINPIRENNIGINTLILLILHSHLSNLYCYPYTLENVDIQNSNEYITILNEYGVDNSVKYDVPNNFTSQEEMNLIKTECLKIASNAIGTNIMDELNNLENQDESIQMEVSSNLAKGVPQTPQKPQRPQFQPIPQLESSILLPKSLTPQTPFQKRNTFVASSILSKRKLNFDKENISTNLMSKYKKQGLIQANKTRKLSQSQRTFGGFSKKINKRKTNKKRIKRMVRKTRRKN